MLFNTNLQVWLVLNTFALKKQILSTSKEAIWSFFVKICDSCLVSKRNTFVQSFLKCLIFSANPFSLDCNLKCNSLFKSILIGLLKVFSNQKEKRLEAADVESLVRQSFNWYIWDIYLKLNIEFIIVHPPPFFFLFGGR